MVVLRNNKTTDIKKIYFSNKVDIQYYFLSKTEKKEKKKVYKKIIKNNNIIDKKI
jgi:ssDNA-specific exonuclease RecJ|tara:strand:- start:1138 stop:1302 length:165 start_codon:yes stop_codon:yes gene_type:complete